MPSRNESDPDGVKVCVSDKAGLDEYAGFFEDDGETGHLYVSDRRKGKILQHLQIYKNSQALEVEERDVPVIWSQDTSKCGVLIWGGMRGIIDVANQEEGRWFVENRDTPPIDHQEWLKGFF